MRLLWLAIAAVACLPATLEARLWTDDTGQHRREAEYLDQHDGKVWLKDDRGKMYVVLPHRLSQADRRYIASREQEQRVAKPANNIKTLAYRIPNLVRTSGSARPSPAQLAVEATITKLTGWRCSGGHCHVMPCGPVKPCPVPPDKGKRIYAGHHSTFHLVCRHEAQICGTGAYKFVDKNGCCHEYLELLNFLLEVPNFWLLYGVENPTPPLGIKYWLFENTAVSKCYYKVSYWSGKQWVPYDHARRRIPE